MPYKDPEVAKLKARENYHRNKDRYRKQNLEWAKANRDRSNAIKKKYTETNPDSRKVSWSTYNQSEEGKKKKHEWYKKHAEKLGIRDWDTWCKHRLENATGSAKYPSVFNKSLKSKIIGRDNHRCQLCLMIEPLAKVMTGKGLAIHHMDYDKNNCIDTNLVTLCNKCNTRVNYNKEFWKVFFGIKKPKTIVVIPSIRETAVLEMLSKFDKSFRDCEVIVVEDSPIKTFNLPSNIHHYAHDDIKKDMGDNSWIIPTKTSAVCSYGYYKAWKMGADMIVRLDDDVHYDGDDFIEKHKQRLFKPRPLFWMNTFDEGYPRGFPYSERCHPTVLNYGLADNILDYDGISQIMGDGGKVGNVSRSIPYKCFAPICGMNIAFLPDIIPAYYFLLQGPEWGFDRFDDIWSGIFLKKITDKMKHVISVGDPVVTHDRLSNPINNYYKESSGMDINEELWKEVNRIKLTKYNYADLYIELATKLNLPIKGYGNKLKEAMVIWAKLFK